MTGISDTQMIVYINHISDEYVSHHFLSFQRGRGHFFSVLSAEYVEPFHFYFKLVDLVVSPLCLYLLYKSSLNYAC